MIIVKLQGGLGNQMFQYACGRALALRHGTEVFIDLHFLLDRSPRPGFTHRDYGLNAFRIEQHFASEPMVRRVGFGLRERVLSRLLRRPARWRHRYYESITGAFREEVRHAPDDVYLDGYWQSHRYFDDAEQIIRQDFAFQHQLPPKAQDISHAISGCNSVCLHVRRADFVTCPLMGTSSTEYYFRAMAQVRSMASGLRFFVFTDDIEWCRQAFASVDSIVHVGDMLSDLPAWCHLELMSRCRHFIISNSTFAWWAAWLSASPEKTVCAPQSWFSDASMNRWTSDLIPAEWMRL